MGQVKGFGARVLILVLMEDALAQIYHESEQGSRTSLNPCFNGRCTRTREYEGLTPPARPVLILVLMEDALAQYEIKKVRLLPSPS